MLNLTDGVKSGILIEENLDSGLAPLRFIDSNTFSCELDPGLYFLLKDIKPKVEGQEKSLFRLSSIIFTAAFPKVFGTVRKYKSLQFYDSSRGFNE